MSVRDTKTMINGMRLIRYGLHGWCLEEDLVDPPLMSPTPCDVGHGTNQL